MPRQVPWRESCLRPCQEGGAGGWALGCGKEKGFSLVVRTRGEGGVHWEPLSWSQCSRWAKGDAHGAWLQSFLLVTKSATRSAAATMYQPVSDVGSPVAPPPFPRWEGSTQRRRAVYLESPSRAEPPGTTCIVSIREIVPLACLRVPPSAPPSWLSPTPPVWLVAALCQSSGFTPGPDPPPP